MDKVDKKSFFRFLDSAATGEIERKLVGMLFVASRLTDPDAISEAEWMVKQVNLELDARKQAGL